MIVKINVELVLGRDGTIRIQHIVDGCAKPEEKFSTFGIPANAKPPVSSDEELVALILKELPNWIRNRFSLEAMTALQKTLREEP